MTTLPDPRERHAHAPTAGQPNLTDAILEAAVDNAIAEARRHDATPQAFIGNTPPVIQPGKAPMSETAANVSGVMVASSLPILALGGAATGILWASGHADPTVVGCIVAAPAALAVPLLALSRLVKRAKETVEAAPPIIHQHYTGTVHQEQLHINSTSRGIIANTRNQLPG